MKDTFTWNITTDIFRHFGPKAWSQLRRLLMCVWVVVPNKLFKCASYNVCQHIGQINVMDRDRLQPNRSDTAFVAACVIHDVAVDEVITATPRSSPNAAQPLHGLRHQEKIHQVIIDQVTLSWMALKSIKGELSSAWIPWQQLKNAFILANLRDSVLARLMHSTVSQHSTRFASSAFIPCPGNWVLLAL